MQDKLKTLRGMTCQVKACKLRIPHSDHKIQAAVDTMKTPRSHKAAGTRSLGVDLDAETREKFEFLRALKGETQSQFIARLVEKAYREYERQEKRRGAA